MKRYGYGILAVLAIFAMTTSAFATPLVNSAVFNLRVFNDCFTSTLTINNNYPTEIWIDDDGNCASGWANLHNWHFSEDGATDAKFMNGDSFRYSATLTITGTGNAEAGLQLAPWWSTDVDGRFNVRTTDGEIACFGGRLPFYTFTGTYSINYVKGDPIWLEIVYEANSNTELDPATITYNLEYPIGTGYSSGPLPFDEGNPSEPYGTWGCLDDAEAGGYAQMFLGDAMTQVRATWGDISFDDLTPTSTESNSWGGVKTLFR
jgi:hypothetical protein